MRAAGTGMLLLLLFGCDHRQPRLSDLQMEKVRTAAPYLTDACLGKIRQGGIESLSRNEDCSRRLPPERWEGLWRNDFEASLFCPAPAQKCTNRGKRLGEGYWLELEPMPAALRNAPPGRLYAVEFIGRRSIGGTPHPGFAQDIVVDRMISLKEVGREE